MKKLLALVVCMFAVAAAVIALSQPASAATVTTLTVVDSEGNSHNMLTESSILGGAVTYDATTGTLTLKNAQGLKYILGKSGDLIIDVQGENTMVTTGADGYIANILINTGQFNN